MGVGRGCIPNAANNEGVSCRREMASHNVLCTPGMCLARNVILFCRSVRTNGLIKCMTMRCLDVCLLRMLTMGRLSQ